MADLTKRERKNATYEKTIELFKKHSQFLLVDMNNVTASQLQTMKSLWRHDTDILLGKNTVIKKAIDSLIPEIPSLRNLIPLLKNNVAFIFSESPFSELKKIMLENSRDTYASVNQIGQKDVWLRKCVTTMGPEKTKFFQALDIVTKITKGKVEISNDVLVLKEGQKVGPSQANLLYLMDIKAFTFFMRIVHVCDDGIVYEPWVVDVTKQDVEESISNIKNSLVAVSLAVGISNDLTVPFELRRVHKNIMGLCKVLDVPTQ